MHKTINRRARRREVAIASVTICFALRVANGIQNIFEQGHVSCNQEQKEISLQINIDGLPLFKSTNYKLWPVLGTIMDLPVKHVFTIGLYGGNHQTI